MIAARRDTSTSRPQLTDRDLAVVCDLVRFGALTVEQVTRRMSPRPSGPMHGWEPCRQVAWSAARGCGTAAPVSTL